MFIHPDYFRGHPGTPRDNGHVEMSVCGLKGNIEEDKQDKESHENKKGSASQVLQTH